jgi:hypothetical protein
MPNERAPTPPGPDLAAPAGRADVPEVVMAEVMTDRGPEAHGAFSLRQCEGCGDTFTPSRRDQRHCRAVCRALKSRHTVGARSGETEPARLIGAFCWCASCRRLVPIADVGARTPEGSYICRGCDAR